MKKIAKYTNCVVTVFISDNGSFQDRLEKASENFMRKVLMERKMVYGNNDKTEYFDKK